MKISIISDIHANHYALDQELLSAKTNKIDKLLVLGDIVGYYYYPDKVLSMLNESEFKSMVKSVREAEKSIGIIDCDLTEKQKKGREFLKSLYVVEKIKKGDVFSDKNIR